MAYKHVTPASADARVPDGRNGILPAGGLDVRWESYWIALYQRGEIIAVDIEDPTNPGPLPPAPDLTLAATDIFKIGDDYRPRTLGELANLLATAPSSPLSTKIDTSSLAAPNGVATLGGGGQVPLSQMHVRMAQFRRALRASGTGRLTLVANTIPADPEDNLNIAWTSEPFVLPGGVVATQVLAVFQASTSADPPGLGMTLSAAQTALTAIFTSAATQPN